jgi:hypothetical protein
MTFEDVALDVTTGSYDEQGRSEFDCSDCDAPLVLVVKSEHNHDVSEDGLFHRVCEDALADDGGVSALCGCSRDSARRLSLLLRC